LNSSSCAFHNVVGLSALTLVCRNALLPPARPAALVRLRVVIPCDGGWTVLRFGGIFNELVTDEFKASPID
jgi:hypothetical protein